MQTHEYLDAYRRATGIASDYGTAKALGVTRQAVSAWRNGRDLPGTLQCFALAAALKIDPARVVADIEHERAQRRGDADQAAGWAQWVDRLSGIAASVAAVVILSAGAWPVKANAGNYLRSSGAVDGVHIGAVRRRRSAGLHRRNAQGFAHVAEVPAPA